MVPPPEFARAVVPRGTTTVITDPHEIGNVLGLDGIRYMFDAAKYNPLSMFVMLPSCVPATDMETSGATLRSYDIEPFKDNPWVLGLAEMMNYPGIINGDPEVLAKITLFKDKIIDGHAPGLSGLPLNAYVAAGIRSDHECTTVEEAREKLRLGMTIFIREATTAHNLDALLAADHAGDLAAHLLVHRRSATGRSARSGRHRLRDSARHPPGDRSGDGDPDRHDQSRQLLWPARSRRDRARPPRRSGGAGQSAQRHDEDGPARRSRRSARRTVAAL